MNELVDAVLSFRFDDLFVLIRQVLDNPVGNLEASLLLLIALVVATLLAILVAVLVIGFRDEGDEEDDLLPDESPAVTPQRARAGTSGRHDRAATTAEMTEKLPLTPTERRWRLTTGVIFGSLALGVAWMLTGVTTGADSMCLSCHSGDMPHVERLAEDSSADPHSDTSCIRCHESGGWMARVTTNVPHRAAHFAQAIVDDEVVAAFGTPIPGGACLNCHGDTVRTVSTNEERGLRMSHAEPLDAGGTCMDCHEMQILTGAVGSWTVGMSSCLRCHDNEQASAECEYCHTKDIAYAVHVNFDPSPKRLVPDTRCGSCHDETKCDACHGLRMPHSAEFLSGTHPREATLDIWYNGGETCKKCHTATRNPCTSCHRQVGPGHPVTAWPTIHALGGPEVGAGGCNGCHGYLAAIRGRNFCGVCHEEYIDYQAR